MLNNWLLSLCTALVLPSLAMDDEAYRNNKTLFDPARCATTKEALAYSTELFASKNSLTLNPAMEAALCFHTSNAIHAATFNERQLGRTVVGLSYSDIRSLSKPALSDSGRFVAFPSTSLQNVELFDIESCKQASYPTCKASHVAFMADKLVATAVNADNANALMVINALVDDRLNMQATLYQSMPLVSGVQGLDISSCGDVVTAHSVGSSDVDTIENNAVSVALVHDIEKKIVKRACSGAGYAIKDRIKWLSHGRQFAMMTDDNCIRLYDLRDKKSICRVQDVYTAHAFDSNEAGDLLCASHKDDKRLIMFDIGQQKHMISEFACADPGIITNMHDNRFIITHDNPSPEKFIMWVDVKEFIQNEACSMYATIDVLGDGRGQLCDLSVCKKNGKILVHTVTDSGSIVCCGNVNLLFDTKIKKPMPHQVACLYALQKARNQAETELLSDPRYQGPVQDTASHDPYFAQIVKAYAPQ